MLSCGDAYPTIPRTHSQYTTHMATVKIRLAKGALRVDIGVPLEAFGS